MRLDNILIAAQVILLYYDSRVEWGIPISSEEGCYYEAAFSYAEKHAAPGKNNLLAAIFPDRGR